MIEIKQLAKKFKVENPKKLSEQEKKDPRLKGRFFNSVQNVNFICDTGQVLGLLGPNGAGKSTIFNMISRFYDPAEGDIFFQGQSILKKSSHEISHPCFP